MASMAVFLEYGIPQHWHDVEGLMTADHRFLQTSVAAGAESGDRGRCADWVLWPGFIRLLMHHIV